MTAYIIVAQSCPSPTICWRLLQTCTAVAFTLYGKFKGQAATYTIGLCDEGKLAKTYIAQRAGVDYALTTRYTARRQDKIQCASRNMPW